MVTQGFKLLTEIPEIPEIPENTQLWRMGKW